VEDLGRVWIVAGQRGIVVSLWGRGVLVLRCSGMAVVVETEVGRAEAVVVEVVCYCREYCAAVEGIVAGTEAALAALVVDRCAVVDFLVALGLCPCNTPLLPFFCGS
jgi:hypothetical protein